MSVDAAADILVLNNTQAKALAGSFLAIGEEVYRFRDYDPAYPGQPPWRSGAEGKAYPLLGRDDAVVAYLKFFTRPNGKRLNRTAWLIGQQMHTWLPGLAAAPLLWVDTRLGVRAAEIGFDFAGYVAQAVPGETWLELKNRMRDAGTFLPAAFRWRCVEDLVLATAVLERALVIHGDLSQNNIVIDPDAPRGEPALCLIDFDAFVALAAGSNQAIDAAAGGTYGTEGYCPPDLSARAAVGDGSVAPYSDRYGRDMLILELLLMEPGLSPDDPPAQWNRDELQRRYAAWRASCDPARWQPLAHLETPQVFSLAEQQRPTSTQLAAALGLELPESPVICTDEPVSSHSAPATPSVRSFSARAKRRPGRRPARAQVQNQSRRAAPATAQPLSRWLVSAQIVPRRHRRAPPRGPLPKDDAKSVVLTIALFMLLCLVLLLPLYSCRDTPGIGRSNRSNANDRVERECLESIGNGASRSAGLESSPRRGVFHEWTTTTMPATDNVRTTKIRLNTGTSAIPALGFSALIPNPVATRATTKAELEVEFRLLDTAERYRTEKEVRETIQEEFTAGKIKREEVFIATKVWNDNHRPERVKPAFEASLKRLRIDYADLYLIHTPFAFQPGDEQDPRDANGNVSYDKGVTLLDTWEALDRLVDEGTCKALGLSDVSLEQAKENFDAARIKPAVVHVESRPYLPQWDLVDYCKKNGIAFQALAALGHSSDPKLRNDSVITAIARRVNKPPAQVLLAWAIQRGTALRTTSKTPGRIEENFDVSTLPEDAMHEISEGIKSRVRFNGVVETGIPGFMPQGK
jgi:diketogulonate reductase-like aldo/keto reductase